MLQQLRQTFETVAKKPLKSMASAYSRHGEQIMGWGYTAGVMIYLTKNFVEGYIEDGSLIPAFTDRLYSTSMDVSSAVLNLISNHHYRQAAQDPKNMRLGAYYGMVATGCVAASGAFGEAPIMHALSMAPTMIGLGLLAADDRSGGTELEGRIDKRLFAGLGELAGRPFHAWAGIQQGDWGQVLAALSWGIGDSGAAASSKTVRKKLGPAAMPDDVGFIPAEEPPPHDAPPP